VKFDRARRLLEDAVAARAFPAAVIEVGDASTAIWREPFGRLTFEDDAAATAEDTIFDLASLTKVLSTTPLVMQQVERGTLDPDDRVAERIAEWKGTDREHVTIRDLLSHCSGLTAYLPFFRDYSGRQEFQRAICALPLEYTPRTESIYSDLGFILLGFVLQDVGGASLATRFDTLLRQMGVVERLQFHPPPQWKREIAPTEQDPWRGRLLVGEVHDENAWALSGAAGHAGLFGTAASVGACARHVLQVLAGRTGAFSRETVETFIMRRTDVPGSSRALGWDTMLPTSSCGTRMSPRAFGHTGFTGTSLWIDPDRGVYVALLTNRVHPTRANQAMTQVRPAVHNAVMEDLLRP
jgi:CubicO group peptidase (beta-lactamase class C family)